jgi:vitamin B12 transporter
MKTTALRFAVLTSLILFAGFRLSAQTKSSISDAHLSGAIVDSSGSGVGGVRVTAQLEGQRDAQIWPTTSTTDGAYTLACPPGRYRLQFNRPAFKSHEMVQDLAAGESRRLNLKMDLEPLSSSVVVTAEVLPTLAQESTAPVSVITREEIEQRQADSLPDLLSYSTGIAIGRTGAEGGSASVFLNGGNSNFTKVLVDGAPINPPGSAVDFSSLTVDNIDKVEIVRGAESAIYGSDAVSGVIQLFTHRGDTRIPEFSAFAEGGDFGSARGGAQIGGLLGAFDYSAAASYFQTDGQGPNDDFLNRAISGNFGYSFSETNQLRLTLRNSDSIAGIAGQTLFGPPNLVQRFGQHIFSSSARWNFSTGRHWRHEVSGGEAYTRQRSADPSSSFDPLSIFQYNRANFAEQSSYVLSKFSATGGYEYEVENAILTSINVPHARRNNQAGFLDFRYRPQRRLALNFGGRAEANGFFGTRVVPRVGASLVLRYGNSFWGQTLYRVFYGQGIKEPRFDQVFGDNSGDFGNPALKPEESKNWTTGIEQKLLRDRIRISAEYFSNHFYNMVTFAFCDTQNNFCNLTSPVVPFGFGYFFNTDSARARGVNLSAETKFTRWLNFAGNYTYDDSRVLVAAEAFDPTELPGNHLLRRPVNSGSLTMNAVFRRFSLTVAGYFTGIRTDSDFLGLGLTHNPGYARFDTSTSYRLGHGLLLYARAANIFDKQYQDALGYPALGRDARVGLKYTFSGRN